MEDKKKEQKEKKPVIKKPKLLTREDEEMFKQDSYESKFYSNEYDRD